MSKSKKIEDMWNKTLNTCDISDFYKYYKKKYWFNCDKCHHSFDISFVKYKNNRWCPYCSKPPKKLCEKEECMICFNKSFASNSKSIFWNNQNDKTPRQVFNGTRKKYLFNCDKCKHIFNISIDAITILNQWCQFCVNQKICQKEDCKECFEKSFASHPKSIYWSDTNKLTPRNILKGTHHKYNFICNICNTIFNIAINKITSENNWCSKCKYKTELKLYNYLQDIYGSDVIAQPKFEWCKYIRNLPFDYLIKNKKCIIELDGLQHFKQISNWQSPEKNQERDMFKMRTAFENGYRIIRLLQNDVLKDLFDWKTELNDAINSNQSIFLCKNNEYEIFKNIKNN